MLIYVIQIKKNGNSGVDNEGDHVEDANTERVINTQVNKQINIIYDHKNYILHKSLDQMNNKVKHNGYTIL